MKCYIAGGDDSKFHIYDLRMGTRLPISSSKAHEAGVTSLHSNALYECLLASGRYRNKGIERL
jgi:WD40 repeat protein